MVSRVFSRRRSQLRASNSEIAKNQLSSENGSQANISRKDNEKGEPLATISEPAFGEDHNSVFTEVPLTRELFLDAYSKGKWNLSVVPAPPCFKQTTLLKAPMSYSESKRARTAEMVLKLPQWNNPQLFQKIINKVVKSLNCTGGAVSIITERCQIVKYEKTLSFKEFPRTLAIDSHAILSPDFFVLLDATKDWRFASNPLVKSVPYIKFYVAVPLITNNGNVVGCLSAFDVFPRPDFSKQSVALLKNYAAQVLTILESPPLSGTDNAAQAVSKRSDLVTERDGSGTAFSQNQHFRLTKTLTEFESKMLNDATKFMLTCANSKNAASYLCRKLLESQGFNFVYIMEIRIVEPFKVNGNWSPQKDRIDLDRFAYKDDLIKCGDESIKTRVLGSYGLNPDSLKFEPLIHYRAFQSEFGIKYNSQELGIRFRSGVCLPILKGKTTLVRRKRISSKMQNAGEPVEVYARSGGYLIAGFHHNTTYVTEKCIDELVKASSIFRQIYLM